MVHAGVIAIRRMMNLSSSFDHRFIDGFDAARLIQTLREVAGAAGAAVHLKPLQSANPRPQPPSIVICWPVM